MSDVSRRFALKVLATGSVGVAARAEAHVEGAAPIGVEKPVAPKDAVGLLYDATKCIGCKACVSKCAEVNGLAPDTGDSGGKWQMPEDLNCQTRNIIKFFPGKDGEPQSFVKQQCMHCVDPSCVAACPFNALSKNGTTGIVEWDGSKCLGCRYCEVACPYEVPKFEWAKVNPRIVKCELCAHRLADGKEPGCTEVCPTGAVIFGQREALLADAHQRLEEAPKGTYFEDRVYGEKEGGGTQVLYLSGVDFTKLGLPALPERSNAHWGTRVHGVIYKYMTGPLVLFAGMFALIRRNWSKHVEHLHQDEEKSGDRPQF
ncbi:MAG TPA: hydrogenase 2 operon protein HybA [Archangium sp.]